MPKWLDESTLVSDGNFFDIFPTILYATFYQRYFCPFLAALYDFWGHLHHAPKLLSIKSFSVLFSISLAIFFGNNIFLNEILL